MKQINLNIALLGEDFVNWGGGIDFLRFCAHSLSLIQERHHLNTCILLPDPDIISSKEKRKRFFRTFKHLLKKTFLFGKHIYPKSAPFSRKQLKEAFSNIEGLIEIVFYNKYEELGPVLRRTKAEVVLPCIKPLMSSAAVPWIGYLNDFQHKYNPDLFSQKDIQRRNIEFYDMLNSSKAIIVNAKSVRDDILKFYPETKCKVFVLPFSAAPIKSWFDPPKTDLGKKYQLPKKYFIISNQFWAHKSHLTAFEALAEFSSTTGVKDIHIVCTGNITDYRNKNYFSSLLLRLSKMEISDRIHFLGHIPKQDQIGVMNGAISVIQPTLFEGGPGGGAVYDAVAIGVPVILSDIPVNLEIVGEDANLYYFKAGDASDLAEKMKIVMKSPIKRTDPTKLLEAGRFRMEKLGETLIEAIKYVIN